MCLRNLDRGRGGPGQAQREQRGSLVLPTFKPCLSPAEGAAGAEAAEEAPGTPHGPAQHGGSAQTRQDTEGGRTGPSGGVPAQRPQ